VSLRLTAGSATVLEVEDDGPGIAPEEFDRVFERFYRSPGALSARKPGTGLGLSIVRDIAHAHHAAVELRRPASGVGLCVRVSFPAARAEEVVPQGHVT
jgi:two-component system sensor histidine kinase TctE